MLPIGKATEAFVGIVTVAEDGLFIATTLFLSLSCNV